MYVYKKYKILYTSFPKNQKKIHKINFVSNLELENVVNNTEQKVIIKLDKQPKFMMKQKKACWKMKMSHSQTENFVSQKKTYFNRFFFFL